MARTPARIFVERLGWQMACTRSRALFGNILRRCARCVSRKLWNSRALWKARHAQSFPTPMTKFSGLITPTILFRPTLFESLFSLSLPLSLSHPSPAIDWSGDATFWYLKVGAKGICTYFYTSRRGGFIYFIFSSDFFSNFYNRTVIERNVYLDSIN